MRLRGVLTAILSCALYALLTAPALAADGGEGLYGKADDKVITNFGFALMIFFTVLISGLSLAQYLLEKRKRQK